MEKRRSHRSERPARPIRVNDRHRAFIREYLIDRRAGPAAVRAGLTAHTGREIMTAPEYRLVRVELERAMEEDQDRHAALRQRIIDERCRIAFADLAEGLDDKGQPLPLSEIPQELRVAISEWKETEFLGQDGEPARVRKLRLWSKNEALTALEKITGLTRERVEHSGAINLGQAREELDAILARLGPPEVEFGGEGGAPPAVEGGSPP